ncbi:acyl-CoA dehydrogenase [Aspergillus udagawae]|uniref:Acyl-CoA dehydrogenase n=1 Tax=Aspergillus udagawae TaxID=91492 RepID=A0A8H3XQM8_9EURO|nr:acyl-CoA dehydrogenase [Aspergillus udagawae]
MTSNNQSSPWEAVASGTTAAILANATVYPLDTIKTRLQVQVHTRARCTETKDDECGKPPPVPTSYDNVVDAISHVVQEEVISDLYRGLSSSILSTASIISPTSTGRPKHGPCINISSNVTIFLTPMSCTTSIAVIVARQQTCRGADEAPSIAEVLRDIVRSEDGWMGLCRGLKVNLILVVNHMITYDLYQWLRGILLRFRKPLGFADAFRYSGLYPRSQPQLSHTLIVAKTMLQSKPPACRDGRPFRGFAEVLLLIIQHEGIRTLYKGLAPQIVKWFLVQGLMMMLKER